MIRGAGIMSAIEITRQDLSISRLRAEAARTADAKQARRILAIAMVLDGHSRLLAAQAGAMDRQTLRDWVHRYNADGLAGLTDRPRPGRQPRLTEAERSEVAKWVEDGPDLNTDGVVRWRCADLRDRIAAKFNVHLHERSIGKLLKKLNFSSISVRPVHPQSDLEAQQAFKKNFTEMARAAIPQELVGRPVEIWFQDEARVGQQGTLTRIWAKRGTRPRIRRDRRFTWVYVRRHLPGARHRCRPGHAGRQYRRHEPASGRNQQMRQRQCHRPADPRRCWLAQFATTHPAREYRAHAASILRA